jgi:hypothetical protein
LELIPSPNIGAIMFREKAARRLGFSLTELLVVILIMVLVLGLLIISIHKLRMLDQGPPGAYTSRHATINNLKQVTLACHSFMDAHKKLPPAFDKFGETTFPASVHIYLLPFVEQDELYKRYVQEQGKGNVNDVIVAPFNGPQDPTLRENDGEGVQSFAANLRAFSDKGWNTAFDRHMPPLAEIEPGAALIPQSFPDGTSNTIAFTTRFAECGDGGSRYAAAPNSKFAAFFGEPAARVSADRWTASSDIPTFQVQPGLKECWPTPLIGQSYTTKGIDVSLFDGSVRRVSPTIDPRTWNLAVQPNDGMKLPDDWNQ